MYSNECVACSTLISLARRASLCPLRQSNRRPHLTHTYSVVGKGNSDRDLCKFHYGATSFSPPPFGIWTPERCFSDFFSFLHARVTCARLAIFSPRDPYPPARPVAPSPGRRPLAVAGGPVCARVHDGHSFCGASDVTNCHCASPPLLPSSLDADPLARPLAPFTPPIPSIPSSATRCACANRRSSQALREAQ